MALPEFDALLDRARAIGAAEVATGHYARIVEGPEGLELHRAHDLDKDQSYYLFELTQEQLAATRFPLGELDKPAVRAIAVEERFASGSIGPKVEAAARFVEAGGRRAVITALEQISEAVHGRAGTVIEDEDG